MTKYRHPKYIERYEDLYFELYTPLISNVANAAHQQKNGYCFVVDNRCATAPLDWYNARLNVDFKVNKLADGGNIAANDHNGIVNGSHSLIANLNVKINEKGVYTRDNVNHVVNIKNLLEYSQGYVSSQGTNEFYFLDTNRSAEELPAQALYNKGFAARKALLGASATVNTEISLNRYYELLPNSRIELRLNLESDANLIWQAADNCRVIITKLQLIIPRFSMLKG